MTTQELILLLETFIKLPGENEIVEFKKAKNGFETQKIGEYFSALSNEANLGQEEYAWLIFGIDDRTHAALILGKYITLPYFYSAREFIEGSATSTTTPVYIVKSAPEYKEEYEGFLYSLAELLKEQEDQSFSGSQIQPPQQATESPSSAPLAQYPKELQQSGPLYTNPTFSTDDEIAFIRSISTMPKETSTITRKRKIKEFFRRNKYLFWLNRLADKRYNQKGLNIVKGMPSYPCSFNTPEKEEILRMISMKA